MKSFTYVTGKVNQTTSKILAKFPEKMRFEVLTVKMSMSFFWVVTLCRLVGGYNVLEEHSAFISRTEVGSFIINNKWSNDDGDNNINNNYEYLLVDIHRAWNVKAKVIRTIDKYWYNWSLLRSFQKHLDGIPHKYSSKELQKTSISETTGIFRFPHST